MTEEQKKYEEAVFAQLDDQERAVRSLIREVREEGKLKKEVADKLVAALNERIDQFCAARPNVYAAILGN